MADLQSRLAQLIGYSSQLIFVGCDSLSHQQTQMSQFLSTQGDSAEISFFSAQTNGQVSEYRKTICRQLCSMQVGTFARPLQHLLVQQLDAQQRYLIGITSADLLTPEFVLELWQWLASTREHEQEIHVNVVLFAKSDWASKMQDWLPTQDQRSPVLLSHESLDAVGFDVNALESLMAERRAFFADKSVFGLNPSQSSFIHKRWFIASTLGVFLMVFVGLLAWQYPDEAYELVRGNSLDLAEESQILPSPNTEDFTPSPSKQTTSHEQVSHLNPKDNSQQVLVKSWQERQKPPTDELKSIANQSGDFKVPDIISVEQLEQELNLALPEQTLTLADNPHEAGEATLTEIDTSDIDHYRFDEDLLLQLPNDQVLIQLSSIQDPEVLQSFLSSNQLKSNTWVYQTERYGSPWYVVLYGDIYSNNSDARNQLSNLPESLQNAKPFTKTVAQIRFEITGFN